MPRTLHTLPDSCSSATHSLSWFFTHCRWLLPHRATLLYAGFTLFTAAARYHAHRALPVLCLPHTVLVTDTVHHSCYTLPFYASSLHATYVLLRSGWCTFTHIFPTTVLRSPLYLLPIYTVGYVTPLPPHTPRSHTLPFLRLVCYGYVHGYMVTLPWLHAFLPTVWFLPHVLSRLHLVTVVLYVYSSVVYTRVTFRFALLRTHVLLPAVCLVRTHTIWFWLFSLGSHYHCVTTAVRSGSRTFYAHAFYVPFTPDAHTGYHAFCRGSTHTRYLPLPACGCGYGSAALHTLRLPPRFCRAYRLVLRIHVLPVHHRLLYGCDFL